MTIRKLCVIALALLTINTEADSSADSSVVDLHALEDLTLQLFEVSGPDNERNVGAIVMQAANIADKWPSELPIRRMYAFIKVNSELMYLAGEGCPYRGITYLPLVYDNISGYNEAEERLWDIDFGEHKTVADAFINVWLPFARAGDPIAQYYLSLIHEEIGQPALAYRWVIESAEGGLLRAQLLAHTWLAGLTSSSDVMTRYVSHNPRKAGYWLMRLALQDPMNHGLDQYLSIFSLELLALKSYYQSARRFYPHDPHQAYSILTGRYNTYDPLIDGPPPTYRYNIPILQAAYIVYSYRYANSDDDRVVSQSRSVIRTIESLLNEEALHAARLLFAAYKPQPEISALDSPWLFGGQQSMRTDNMEPQIKLLLDSARADTGHFTDEFENELKVLIAAEQSTIGISPQVRRVMPDTHETSHFVYPDYNERLLRELERSNRAREHHMLRAHNLEAFRLFIEQLNQSLPSNYQPLGHRYEIRSRYPAIGHDPFSPDGSFNPYIIERRP